MFRCLRKALEFGGVAMKQVKKETVKHPKPCYVRRLARRAAARKATAEAPK